MNKHSVFTHCYLPPVAVKHGFNGPSLFFGPLWALSVGFWQALAIYTIMMLTPWLGFGLPLEYGPRIIASLAYLVLGLASATWLSTFMNAWRMKTLLSKGYIEADVVMAMDTRHALCLSSLVRPVTCFELPAH